jgi:tetratricopeptide (TPR) repeat protein
MVAWREAYSGSWSLLMRRSDTLDQALIEAVKIYRQKRYAEAEVLVDRILATAPRHAGAQQLKALLALLRGDIDRAADAAAVSLAKRPGHAQTVDIARKTALALLRAAQTHAAQGNAPRALSRFRQALGLDRTNADGWFGLGLALQDIKDYAGAAEAFEQVGTLRPGDARALVNRAVSLQQSGNLADAMASYRLAYQTDPSTFAAISQALSAASTGLLVLDLETLRDRLSKS